MSVCELLMIQCNKAWNATCETAKKSLAACEFEKKRSVQDILQTQIKLAWSEAFDTFMLLSAYILEAMKQCMSDQDNPLDSLVIFGL